MLRFMGSQSRTRLSDRTVLILVMGFVGQDYWSGLPFCPSMDHVLLELLSMTDAEAPILWPPDVNSQLIGKDPDSGKH